MSNVVLKCTSSSGSSVLKGLTSESTLQDLQLAIQNTTQIAAEKQKIRSGFPPRPISTEDKSAVLGALGIRSGDTVHVEGNATNAPNPSQGAPAVGTTAAPQNTRPPPKKRGIIRKVVPANNSCLFASLGFLLQGDSSDSIAKALRYVVGNTIVANPGDYPEVMLGKPPQEYAEWIQNSARWGGGIELAVLAKYFNTEIHVVDTQSLRIDKFGQDLRCPDKTYVIYDGIHYDPLYEPSPSGHVTVFPVADLEVENAAMLLASNAKKVHNYTDLANFTLRCGSCGTGLAGEKDAREHAKQTGHTNFEEYK